MIEVKHVSKNFGGSAALSSVTFSCMEGTITGLVGPNGSGKSTLLDVMTGILSADEGVVHISGSSGRTFQDVRIWEHMTVAERILLALKSRNLFSALFDFSKHHGDLEVILDRVGLSDQADSEARHLSYGQRKLLEIGRAIATPSKNLFLDEPFAGLFPEMVERVKKIIRAEALAGKAIVLVEHDTAVIRDLCEAVLVLDAGRVIEIGEVDEVFSRASVIEAYLGK